MLRQLVKHCQIGSHWRFVIAVPLLLLLGGPIVATTITVCPKSIKSPDHYSWHWMWHEYLPWAAERWHCWEMIKSVNKKVPSAIDYWIKKPPAVSERHVIRR